MFGVGFITEPEGGGGTDVGLDALCDVVANMERETGSAGTPPAAAQAQPEQISPPGGPAGGQGGADIREWPPPDALDQEKLAVVRQLKGGNTIWTSVKLTGWKPAKTKPTKLELWQVIMERNPAVRPKGWNLEKMMSIDEGLGSPKPGKVSLSG